MHNDHLDPDRNNGPYTDDDHKPDPPVMAWHMSRVEDEKETLIGTFSSFDGEDAMESELVEWMVESDYCKADEITEPGFEWFRGGLGEYGNIRLEWRAISLENDQGDGRRENGPTSPPTSSPFHPPSC